jgi:hypothetical protein
MYPLGTMVCGLRVQNGKIIVNIMCLVGRNLVKLCYCRISVGGIELDSRVYACLGLTCSFSSYRNKLARRWIGKKALQK